LQIPTVLNLGARFGGPGRAARVFPGFLPESKFQLIKRSWQSSYPDSSGEKILPESGFIEMKSEKHALSLVEE